MAHQPVSRVAVVTGAKRGIGFATFKELFRVFNGTVYLTGRHYKDMEKVIYRLRQSGYAPNYHQLDVKSEISRQIFFLYLKSTYGRLDVLINSAAVKYNPDNCVLSPHMQAKQTINTNFIGTALLCQTLFPLLRPHARVVNLSGSTGFLSDIPSPAVRSEFARENLTRPDLLSLMQRYKDAVTKCVHIEQGWGEDYYSVSQVAINALTGIDQRMLDSCRPGEDLVVNAYNPGVVSTPMSGFKGVSTSEAAKKVVALATLHHDVTSPVGQLVWHNLTVVDWRGPKPEY